MEGWVSQGTAWRVCSLWQKLYACSHSDCHSLTEPLRQADQERHQNFGLKNNLVSKTAPKPTTTLALYSTCTPMMCARPSKLRPRRWLMRPRQDWGFLPVDPRWVRDRGEAEMFQRAKVAVPPHKVALYHNLNKSKYMMMVKSYQQQQPLKKQQVEVHYGTLWTSGCMRTRYQRYQSWREWDEDIVHYIFLTFTVAYPLVLLMVMVRYGVFWHCWLGCMKGKQPVKKLSGRILAWLSIGKLQICIWPSWCHCHSLSFAPVNPKWLYLPGSTFLFLAHPGSPG